MAFEDIYTLEGENKQLRIELEEITKKYDELETAYLYTHTQNERVKMVFAYREQKILQDEYRKALEKEAWELIEKQADKKFTEWIKKYHDIEQVKIKATIQP
jgi:hypothetical protein